MALGRKTGGRKKGSLNRKTRLLAAAVSSENETPVEFLLKVMRAPQASIEQRMRAAIAAAPYCHVKPNDAGPKIIEVVRPAIEPGRERALMLTLKKYSNGISDAEAAELEPEATVREA